MTIDFIPQSDEVLQNFTDDQLDREHHAMQTVGNLHRAYMKRIQQEKDRRAKLTKARSVVQSLSPEEREAVSQLIGVDGIESAEQVSQD
jgi:hypothetical protein